MRTLMLIVILSNLVLGNYSNKIVQKRYLKVEHIIVEASKKHNVPFKLLKSMLYIESRFNPNAVSPTGPVGISQFTLETSKRYSVDRLDVESSIHGMAKAIRHEYNNSSDDFTEVEKWKISAYIYNMGKSSYWYGKKRVTNKGFKPTYANVTLQIAIRGKNNEGLHYVGLIKI
jgi:membrane-bound lytic murein transglycosylase F